MNKLWILLRVQMMGLLGINKVVHSNDKKEKRKFIRFTILMIFVAISVLFTLVMYDFMFADVFSKAGVPELMPALMMAAASLVTMITTVYKVNGLLVGFRDFDMTMAMPVKTHVVATSRLLVLYIMNLGFCLLINIPAGIVYTFFAVPKPSFHAMIFAAPPPTFYPFMIILTLFVPMIPMLIGATIGIIITAMASRFRHANIINIIITLMLTLAFMTASFASPAIFTNPYQTSKTIMDSVYGIYPLTRMYTQAVCGGSMVSMILFVAISAVLLAAFSVILSLFFKWLNTSFTTSRTRSNYRMTSLRASSALGALYKRELRRYFSSVLYVMNTGFGMVMALIMCVTLLFFKPDQLEEMLELPGFAETLGALPPMLLAVFVSLSCTTSCAISLEGKSLWIIKSLPVEAIRIFHSKILVNLTITVPASLICALLMSLAIPMNAIQILFTFVTPVMFAVLSALLGLFLNLLYPNFSWTSETTVIKQSLPMFLSVVGGMMVSIGLLVGLMYLPSSLQTAGLAAVTLAAAVIDFVLYRLLQTKGARLFHAL